MILKTLLVISIYIHLVSAFSSSWSEKQESSQNLHFAIVVDAGSSGSRAYLYKWPDHSNDLNELLKISPLTEINGEPMVKSVSPGLSSFSENPQNAFEYMRPLIQYAADRIPPKNHQETPLFILATAGMRLIEHDQQDAIITNVRNGISKHFDFHFPEGNLEIISGKQEGIYQWLAINYVLDKFDHGGSKDENIVNMPDYDDQVDEGRNVYLRPKTVGALDMGGASMQIAMEVTSDLSLQGFSVSVLGKPADQQLINS